MRKRPTTENLIEDAQRLGDRVRTELEGSITPKQASKLLGLLVKAEATLTDHEKSTPACLTNGVWELTYSKIIHLRDQLRDKIALESNPNREEFYIGKLLQAGELLKKAATANDTAALQSLAAGVAAYQLQLQGVERWAW